MTLFTHTQCGWREDDIKICKLHPIIRSKFSALTFHRSQASSVSLQKLWKNRKESKRSFYDPPEAAPDWTFSFQFKFFGSITDTSPPPAHSIRLQFIDSCSSFMLYWNIEKSSPWTTKSSRSFTFDILLYLFVSGGPRKVNLIFGELLRRRLNLSHRCVLKSILRPPLKTRINRKPKTFPVIGFLLFHLAIKSEKENSVAKELSAHIFQSQNSSSCVNRWVVHTLKRRGGEISAFKHVFARVLSRFLSFCFFDGL